MNSINNNLIDAVNNNVTAGTFGLTIVTLTEPKMNKTDNPFFGKVKKLNVQKNVALGISYKSQCENRQEKSGNERGYEVAPLKGTHYFDKFFNQSDKDENQFYLKVGYRDNSDCSQIAYFIGRDEADEKDMAELKKWLPKDHVCKKQIESGINPQNAVMWRTIKTQNVIAVYQGDKIIFGEKLTTCKQYADKLLTEADAQ